MENNFAPEIAEHKKIEIKENSDIAYWAKEYDISPEDLKNEDRTTGILDKIVESYLQKAS